MVLLAAEHTNIWLWVLLEIASFGTFLSFLKLGYFAFLRPGTTEASDPPLLMQAAMLGAAALCIAIGVYPPLLYAILPYPTGYQAYDPVTIVGTLLILGAAATFFFTIGKRILEPHDTQLRDIDMLYIAVGHGIAAGAAKLQESFRVVYDYALDTAHTLIAVGVVAMRMEDRDVNWNVAFFSGTLIIVVSFLLLGVKP